MRRFFSAICQPIICFCATGLLLCSSCTSEPRERVERYGNGAVKSRVPLVGGKKKGMMIDYYPDGQTRAERWFEDDLQSGRTLYYYPDGQVQEVQHYSKGKKEGGDTVWYANRQIQFAVQLKEGKKDGYLRKWSPDGTLVFEARYELDTLVEVKGEALPVHRNPGSLDTARLNVPASQF